MSYLLLNPEFAAMEKELRELDRRRDHLRAQMADVALRAEMEEISKNTSTLWLHPQIRHARMAAMAEKIGKRQARRAKEMEVSSGRERARRLHLWLPRSHRCPSKLHPQRFGSYTRPGTWDEDLDDFQEPRYDEDVGEGYQIRLVRARDLTWNGYVVLPEKHWAVGKHYDFFGCDSPAGLELPPQNLTYGGPGAEERVYGFYLTGIVTPREDYPMYHHPHKFFSVEQTGATYVDDGNLHFTYGKMRKLCMELVDYFKKVVDPKTRAQSAPAASALAPTETTTAQPAKAQHKKSWADIAGGK